MDKKIEKKNVKKNEYFTDEDYLDMTASSSAADCTGLIPEGSNQINSYDDYNDLYQYGIPHVDAQSSNKSSGVSSRKSADVSTGKSKK